MRPRTDRRRSITRKLLLAAASTLLTLVVLEIVFRAASIRGEYHAPRINRIIPMPGKPVDRVEFGFYSNAIVVTQYDSDPRGYFERGNTISHAHNSIGWRDIEHTLEKPDGVFRILGLGDSYLWGQGVKHEDICLNKLPELLEHSLDGKTIETINAGISAYNTVDQRDQFVNRAVDYSPDLVVLHFVLNDVELPAKRQGPKVEFFASHTSPGRPSDQLSELSCLWSWGRHRFLSYVQSETYIRESINSLTADHPGWLACQGALADIKQVCDAKDASFCVVVFPFYFRLDVDYPFQPVHTAVVEHCKSLGINVLDLRDAYREFSGPDLWVHPTDEHPNEIAHEIAAQEIARHLLRHQKQLLRN